MLKRYILTGCLAAVFLATASPVQADTPANTAEAAKIMAPPPAPDEVVITVLAHKKYKGTPTPGVLDPCSGSTDLMESFILSRICIASRDHSLRDADLAYAAGDFPKALEMYKYAYEKMGYENAGLMVARMYFFGQGIDRDVPQAIVWLKRLAQNPLPLAQDDALVRNFKAYPPGAEASMTLARIYQHGWEVPVDAKEARHWYARADDLGYYPATLAMGDFYRSGYGGERNLGKAVICYKRAAKAGYGPAQYTLAQIYYLGDGVRPDKSLGLSWLLTAATTGYPDALYAVGRFYETGQGGVPVDPAKALVYYKEAAVKGQPAAEEAVGRAFYLGNGLSKDLTTARRWFEKASEGADPDAMFNLAVMLINGEGGDKDYVQAWVWLKIADAGGHPKAQAALAELEPKMTAEERAKAQALFQPAGK